MSTAYDPATKSSATNYSVSDSGDDLQGMGFSSGGTKMFIVTSIDDDIHEYNLSTGFDVFYCLLCWLLRRKLLQVLGIAISGHGI